MVSASNIVINSEERMRQLHSFDGMVRHRGIYPSDIDGLINYNGKAKIIFEGKVIGATIPSGQKKMIQDECDGWDKGCGRGTSIAIIYEHDSNPDETVYVAKCKVSNIYYQGSWHDKYKGYYVIDVVGKVEKYWLEKDISI